MGHDEHHHPALLQQAVGLLVEALLQPLAAAARLLGEGRLVGDRVAIRRVVEEQPVLGRFQRGEEEVTVDAALHQPLGVVGALLVVLHRVGLAALGPQVVLALGDGHALPGAGVEDAHRALGTRCQGREDALQRPLVGGEVAVPGEVVGQAWKDQSHGSLPCFIGGAPRGGSLPARVGGQWVQCSLGAAWYTARRSARWAASRSPRSSRAMAALAASNSV